MNKNPLAVVISDIHYTLNTIELADTALRMAIDKAAELKVPLIDCGDITDTKAIIRAEVMNKLLDTVQYAVSKDVAVASIVGNHSLVNEKSTSAHALRFLDDGDVWFVYDKPASVGFSDMLVIPYQPSAEDFYHIIKKFRKGAIVFAHQGNIGGAMGDYIQDRSAVDPSLLTDWRVFSGHYHAHYENKNWVSIGNPYTLTYGEANDAPKGFLIVYDDGSYDRVLTNLRRHWKIDGKFSKKFGVTFPAEALDIKKDDLVWLRVEGTRSELATVKKDKIAKSLGVNNFKLDLVPYEDEKTTPVSKSLTNEQLLDKLIVELSDTDSEKQYLKQLWRKILED